MKKIIMWGLLCVCFVSTVGCGCSKQKNNNLEKIDESTLSGQFFEDQTLDVLKIENFNIAVDGESFVSFDVKNTTKESVSVQYIKVLMYDENDGLVVETYGYVGGTLNASETKHITIDVDIDLSNVARVAYEKM